MKCLACFALLLSMAPAIAAPDPLRLEHMVRQDCGSATA
jgi:hypothetical protein